MRLGRALSFKYDLSVWTESVSLMMSHPSPVNEYTVPAVFSGKIKLSDKTPCARLVIQTE